MHPQIRSLTTRFAAQARRLRELARSPRGHAVVVSLLVVALLTEASLDYWLSRQMHDAQHATTRDATELLRLRKQPAPQPPTTFVGELPFDGSVDSVVRALRQEAATANVTFVSAAGASKPAGKATLARLEFKTVLRGDYAKLKAVVSNTLGNVPGLQVEHIVFAKLPAAGQLEARVDFVLALRPAATPASGARS